MQLEREHRLQQLFNIALQQPRGERSAFLAHECDNDPALGANLRELLACDELASVEGFLDPSVATPTMHDGTGTGSSGRRLGPYALRELLGSGGMGSVYRAVRVEDFEQEVAVKVVLAGLETEALLHRFQTERQLLAGLNHPGIARLLDGGVAEDGQPYFVMEYVAGQPLSRYCESHALSTLERVGLLSKICVAMEYAHSQGVIHRDLKPGNVLVTEDGSPKIVDFGLAKRVIEGGEANGRTQTGAVLGTPSYMAPEQAAGQIKQIDPRTDVYALGAMLYELLTGCPPFRADTPLETMKLVLDIEPIPPSRMHAKLPRDLETICLKCLRKEPSRRFASAEELGEDLQRFLDGKPIHSRPIGPLERGWRWCRRKPAIVAMMLAVSGFFLAVICGFSVSMVLWHRSLQSEARVLAGEAEALESRRKEEVALQIAEDGYAGLRAMLLPKGHPRATQSLLSEDASPARKAMLVEAESCLSLLITRGEKDVEPRVLLATVLTQLGAISVWQHQYAEGQMHLERASTLWENLKAEEANKLHYRAWRAIAWAYLKQLYDQQGRVDHAQKAFNVTFSLWNHLVNEPLEPHCKNALVSDELAIGWVVIGGWESENEVARRSKKLRACIERAVPGSDADLFVDLARVAYLHAEAEKPSKSQRPADVLVVARESASILQRLQSRTGLNRNTRSHLALIACQVSTNLRRGKAPAEALSLSERLNSELRELLKDDPKDHHILIALSESWNEISKVHWVLNEPEPSLSACRNALEAQRQVFLLAPQDPQSRVDLGSRYLRLGRKLCELGRLDEAETCFYERQALWLGDTAKHEEALRELRKWAAQVGDDKPELSAADQEARQRYLDLCARLEKKGVTKQ